LRKYKDVMNFDEEASMIEEERDFFARELESMGWGLVREDMLNEAGDDRELAAPGGPMNGSEWDGGPLQMEGW
jgi:hypothetical protein